MCFLLNKGFLGFNAPLFMDLTLIITALLPLLAGFGIYLAKIKKYKLHKIYQLTLLFITLIVLGVFEYLIRKIGGFSVFDIKIDKSIFILILTIHIIIAFVTIVFWIVTILKSSNVKMHKIYAMFTFYGIIFTSVSAIIVYLLLFVA